MAEAKPARRRIIPVQIFSPTKSQAETESLAATTVNRVELGDLKEHSAIAAELLGPGRKIYVDLAAYQREEKAVDWKEVGSFTARNSSDPIFDNFTALALVEFV